MRLALAVLLAPAVALWPAPARAEVDWAQGLVTVGGVGVADRHAPNPAVARGTSRRTAEDAARKKLAAEIAALPLAAGAASDAGGKSAGGKVGHPKDAAASARLAAAVDHALELTAEPETDGAWRVTMAVPIEAVRQALAGPRVLSAAGDEAPAVVIVDGVTGKPMVGALPAAAIWVTDVPAWAKDAPHVTGKRGKGGAIEGIDVQPQALYVIVGKR